MKLTKLTSLMSMMSLRKLMRLMSLLRLMKLLSWKRWTSSAKMVVCGVDSQLSPEVEKIRGAYRWTTQSSPV